MTLEERFWSKVDRNGPAPKDRPDLGACWLWIGGDNGAGFGILGVGSRTDNSRRKIYAHRLSYELRNGEIPTKLELDHICRMPRCVNPDHLEPVTHKENVRRGLAMTVNGHRQKAKTHCPKGHPYAGNNLKITSCGGRYCWTCKKEKARLAYIRKRDVGRGT